MDLHIFSEVDGKSQQEKNIRLMIHPSMAILSHTSSTTKSLLQNTLAQSRKLKLNKIKHDNQVITIFLKTILQAHVRLCPDKQ